MKQPDDARELLEIQRTAFRAEGIATAEVRQDRLDRALDLLVTHQTEICDAIAGDFGRRPATLTRFADVLPSVMALKHARRQPYYWGNFCRAVAINSRALTMALSTAALVQTASLGVERGYFRPISSHAALAASCTRFSSAIGPY